MNKEINYGKRKTYSVLNKIRELIKITPENNLLIYRIENCFSENNYNKKITTLKEDEIIHDLQKWGILKIIDRERLDGELIYYIEVLNKFDKAYLDHKKLIAEKQNARYSKIIAGKLNFYPKNGDTEYKTAIWQFTGKARAFLTILNENKNMNFKIEDIKKFGNPLITIDRHQFRNTRDINDTLREIRFRLKVNKGEFFPILKQKNGWIWLEK